MGKRQPDPETFTRLVYNIQKRGVAFNAITYSAFSPRLYEFYTTPITTEQARAHLELTYPEGIVIICCNGRGNMGGWGTLYFTRRPMDLPSDHDKIATIHLHKRWIR